MRAEDKDLAWLAQQLLALRDHQGVRAVLCSILNERPLSDRIRTAEGEELRALKEKRITRPKSMGLPIPIRTVACPALGAREAYFFATMEDALDLRRAIMNCDAFGLDWRAELTERAKTFSAFGEPRP